MSLSLPGKPKPPHIGQGTSPSPLVHFEIAKFYQLIDVGRKGRSSDAAIIGHIRLAGTAGALIGNDGIGENGTIAQLLVLKQDHRHLDKSPQREIISTLEFYYPDFPAPVGNNDLAALGNPAEYLVGIGTG